MNRLIWIVLGRGEGGAGMQCIQWLKALVTITQSKHHPQLDLYFEWFSWSICNDMGSVTNDTEDYGWYYISLTPPWEINSLDYNTGPFYW